MAKLRTSRRKNYASNETKGKAQSEGGVVRTKSHGKRRTEELMVATITHEITRELTTATATAILVTNRLVILMAEVKILAMVEVVQEYPTMDKPTTKTVDLTGSMTSISLTLVANVLRKGSSTVETTVTPTIKIATTKASSSTLARLVDVAQVDFKMVVTVMARAKVVGVANNKPMIKGMSGRLTITSLLTKKISTRVATIARSSTRTQAGMTKMELKILVVEVREQANRKTGELLK